MPKRNREDIGKPDNDQRTVKTERVDNPNSKKVDVVKFSKLQSDSVIESSTQKEDANPGNTSVADSTTT